ncbi:MAG: CDP-alcohol phosphatidyltransferase family protein [Nitrolancea sp.]
MANLITIGRLLLLFVTIALVYSRSYSVVVWCTLLIGIVFASDALDGFVARRRQSTSDLGAVIDIAGDRVVENALWVVFAQLGLIGVWAPLLVLTRGFFVDAMRGMSYSAGKTAFGEKTMMRTPLSQFIAASRFMRAFYGVAKALGFVFLTSLFASHLSAGSSLDRFYSHDPIRYFGWAMVYSALALTVIRGVPVLIDAMYYVRDPKGTT